MRRTKTRRKPPSRSPGSERAGIASDTKEAGAPSPAPAPIRLLTAVPICDGHDSAINTINLEFIRHGFEVVYLGYHRSARDMVRAAIQEDVRAIGISSYNGGHVEFFTEVVELLGAQAPATSASSAAAAGRSRTTTPRQCESKGVDRIFFAGTPLSEMLEWVRAPTARRFDAAATATASTRSRPTAGSRNYSSAAESSRKRIDATRTARQQPPARHRRHRSRRRGEDHADRRTGPALPPLATPSFASPSSRTTRASSAKARCSATARR